MSVYYQDEMVTLHLGDALDVMRTLSDGSVNCIVTSPPYFGLRDYGVAGQYGLEASPAEYVEQMREVFAEARRVLTSDGTLWLNLGDSYSSAAGGAPKSSNAETNGGQRFRRPRAQDFVPPKNLLGIPWRTALALQDDGWILRSEVIWAKPNGMPSSVKDRPSNKHEHVFLLAKSPRYWFNLDAIREEYDGDRALNRRTRSGNTNKENSSTTPWTGVAAGGRNPGDVWSLATQPFPDAHFACMPFALAERCILAGCRPGGVVLDLFSGSGTTGAAAGKHGRRYIGIDLNPEYLELSLATRLAQASIADGVA